MGYEVHKGKFKIRTQAESQRTATFSKSNTKTVKVEVSLWGPWITTSHLLRVQLRFAIASTTCLIESEGKKENQLTYITSKYSFMLLGEEAARRKGVIPTTFLVFIDLVKKLP